MIRRATSAWLQNSSYDSARARVVVEFDLEATETAYYAPAVLRGKIAQVVVSY